MRRILIIGDSQTACMIKTIQKQSEDVQQQFSFFTFPSMQMADFVVENGDVIATSDEAKNFLTRIQQNRSYKLSDFDAVVLVMNPFGQTHLIRLALKDSTLFSAKHPELVADYKERNLISRPSLAATFRSLIASSIVMKVGRRIRSQSDAHVILIRAPNFSQGYMDLEEFPLALKILLQSELQNEVNQIFEDACRDIVEGNNNIDLLVQPEETVFEGIFTKSQYTKGAFQLHNLEKRQLQSDYLHANNDYGDMMFKTLMSVLN